eukprot:scaffold122991_cov37-Tisochrysis_lutea.AAC.2
MGNDCRESACSHVSRGQLSTAGEVGWDAQSAGGSDSMPGISTCLDCSKSIGTFPKDELEVYLMANISSRSRSTFAVGFPNLRSAANF